MAVLLPLTACQSDNGFDRVFGYDISANPVTLDPQQANDANSNLIIGNLYMGLLTVNRDGSIGTGAASDYTVSEDGLKYHFTLRQDVYWVNVEGYEKQCTAKDFVYGFTRLFLPETNAPHAADYYCIENARDINMGWTAYTSRLGVKALGDFELEITLSYPNPRFPAMLAEPPAMPCDEEFFLNARGKYGLSAECTPSNGSFYVRSWNYDPYASTDVNRVLLSRNRKNAEAWEICPAGLNFYIEKKDDFVPDFLHGDTAGIALSNDEKSLIKGNYGCEEFCSVTCGLVFNRKFELFKNEDFIKALSLLANREEISAAISEFEKAEGIVPKQVTMSENNYRETAGSCVFPERNTEKARELFLQARSGLNTDLFTGARVIVCSAAANTAVSYIMQEWQREFGFYCVVETLSENDFKKRLQSGDFELAVTELSGKYNSPAAYLEQFCTGNSENYIGYSDYEFDSLIKRAVEASDLEKSAEYFKQAEQQLIDSSAFLPLYYKNEYFFTGKKNVDIIYNPFSKTVNFTHAKVKKR